MVEEPGRQADGCVRQVVADRLRTRALDNAVSAVIRRERDLFVRALFRVREASWRRIAVADVAEHAGRNHLREVDVDAEQPFGRLAGHRGRDRGAPVAALRDVAGISQSFHQHRPRAGDAVGTPAGGGGLARKPVARQRRNHHVERVRRAPAVSGGIGERLDDLQLLDDRAWPAVRDDERQRVLLSRPDVDEMDVEPVDLVMNCGSVFSFASHLRQSYSAAQ